MNRFALQAFLSATAASSTLSASILSERNGGSHVQKDWRPSKLAPGIRKDVSSDVIDEDLLVRQYLRSNADNFSTEDVGNSQPLRNKVNGINSAENSVANSKGNYILDLQMELGILQEENQQQDNIHDANDSTIATDFVSERELSSEIVKCQGYHPLVKADTNFANLVNECLYGTSCPYDTSLGCWNTSEVTNMAHAFSERLYFNQPIDGWQTAQVTDMTGMFRGAKNFQQSIGSWDTSSVTSMKEMFAEAESFNSFIGHWETHSVDSMNGMFSRAMSFNQPIQTWRTSRVTDMRKMFAYAESFHQPLDNWKTLHVEDMGYMFAGAKAFNGLISSWDTSSVTDMNRMFFGAESFNIPLESWKTSMVEDMGWMFGNARSFNQNVDAWEIYSVTNMVIMFKGASSFNQCLSTWASQTCDEVELTMMLASTGCPYTQDPDTSQGPWCQGRKQKCYAANKKRHGNSAVHKQQKQQQHESPLQQSPQQQSLSLSKWESITITVATLFMVPLVGLLLGFGLGRLYMRFNTRSYDNIMTTGLHKSSLNNNKNSSNNESDPLTEYEWACDNNLHSYDDSMTGSMTEFDDVELEALEQLPNPNVHLEAPPPLT